MIRFKLLSGRIYEVTVDEWLGLEKWLKKIATIIIDDWEKTKHIENPLKRRIEYITQLFKELGLKPPIRERLSISGRGEHLSEARCPF